MYFHTSITLGLLAITQLVAGHGAIVKAVGDAGGVGSAIGVDPNTPRDGTRRDPFQADSTRFKGDNADSCGQTIGAGENDIQAGTKAVMAMMGDKLPQVSAGGSLEMTVHQVNGDGAGPYTCEMNTDASGANWQAIDVQTNVPGQNSRSRAKATDFPLKAAMPAQMACTGTLNGQNNVCLVRCMNAARAGPFGGCVPVQAVAAAAPAAPANNSSNDNNNNGNNNNNNKRAVFDEEDDE